jgi:hypothetical protein
VPKGTISRRESPGAFVPPLRGHFGIFGIKFSVQDARGVARFKALDFPHYPLPARSYCNIPFRKRVAAIGASHGLGLDAECLPHF